MYFLFFHQPTYFLLTPRYVQPHSVTLTYTTMTMTKTLQHDTYSYMVLWLHGMVIVLSSIIDLIRLEKHKINILRVRMNDFLSSLPTTACELCNKRRLGPKYVFIQNFW